MTSPFPTQRPAPLNLAALVAPLPPVILPDNSEHQLVWTPNAAELFKRVREIRDAVQAGDTTKYTNTETEQAIDDCLAAVLPTASIENLLSFGMRYDVKMSVLMAASGNADRALEMLANRSGKADAGERTPPSPPATISAE